jgi:hypothetical protein
MPEQTGPRVVLLIGSRGVVTAAPMGWSAVRIGAIVMRQSVAGDVRSTDARAGRGAPDRGDPAAAERCARSCATVCLRLHPGSFPGATGTRTPRRRRPRSSWRSRSSRRPAGGHVEGLVGDSNPFVAVQQTVIRGSYDEIIISTLPARVSQWMRSDLPHRVEALGLPVTVVTAKGPERASAPALAADLSRAARWTAASSGDHGQLAPRRARERNQRRREVRMHLTGTRWRGAVTASRAGSSVVRLPARGGMR